MCTNDERDEENGSSNCNCLIPCDDYCKSGNHLSSDQKLALIKWLMILVTTRKFISEFFFLVWSKIGNEDPRSRAGKIKRMIGIVEWLQSTGRGISFGICMTFVVAGLFAVNALSAPRSASFFFGSLLVIALSFGGAIVYVTFFDNFIRRSYNKNILAFVVWMWKLSRLTNLSLDQLVQLNHIDFHQTVNSVMSQLVKDAQAKENVMWKLGGLGLKEDGLVYVRAGTATINAWKFAMDAYMLFKPFGIREQFTLEERLQKKS